jgi:competence protein ComEC
LVLLALEPGSLGEAGLQLSFAATAGLLHLSPPIRAALPAWCPGPIGSALAVSAGAQLGVTPVMLLHFGQLSPLGVVANLFVVPLAGILTTGGVLTLAVAALHEPLAHLLFQSLWLLLVTLRLVVRAFAALPGAVVDVPPPPLLAMVSGGLALAVAPVARGRAARLGVAALALGAAAGTIAGIRPDGLIRVIVLDVGQGEAILVRAPNGQALLVDTGGGGPGRGDRGERVVVPVLRRLGVRRLAALALTDGTAARAGGLAGLLEGIPVDEAWIPAGSEGAAWLAPVAARGIPQRLLARGDRAWLGPVLVTALHPPADPSEPGPPRAEPLLLRIEWGLFATILGGGAGPAAEVAAGQAAVPLGAILLKVGGHGSRRSSTPDFLTAVGARLAAISVGARNPFGHPAPEVLGRLAAGGATIYRTDRDGAIDVRSDGARVWVRAWGRPGPVAEFPLRGAP